MTRNTSDARGRERAAGGTWRSLLMRTVERDEWAALIARRLQVHLIRRDFDSARRTLDAAEREWLESANSPASPGQLAVAELDLPARIVTAIEHLGIVWVKDLDVDRLAGISGFGKGTAAIVQDAMRKAAVAARAKEIEARRGRPKRRPNSAPLSRKSRKRRRRKTLTRPPGVVGYGH